MNNLESTLKEASSDLTQYNNISREDFIAQCALQKLENRTQEYDSSFDKFLSMLNDPTNIDLCKIAESLKLYSDIISALYERLIKELDTLNKFSSKLTQT